MTALFAGLVLGLAGSGHCAAMCGPLLLAFRQRESRSLDAFARGVAYHSGRTTVYAALGVAAGGLGRVAALGGLGRWLAVSAGAALIAAAAGRLGLHDSAPRVRLTRTIARALASASRWMRHEPITGSMVVGGLNGLLPCGMVYGALTAATGFGTPSDAVIFMTAFGVGTMPALMSVWMAAGVAPVALRTRLKLVGPIALALVGVLLIARGVGVTPPGATVASQHSRVHVH